MILFSVAAATFSSATNTARFAFINQNLARLSFCSQS